MFDTFITKSLRELITEVVEYPLLHFSEKSLQVRLAAKLIQYPQLSTPIPTRLYERYKKQIDRLESDKTYLAKALGIPPLQMEYGTNDKSSHRIDIAILDPAQIKSIDNWQFQYNKKYLVPLIAIEIGTEKSGIQNMPRHLLNDAFKVRQSKKGYILNVIRNTNVCHKSSMSYLNKLDQIKSFKDGLKDAISQYPNINWINLIIHNVMCDFFRKKPGPRSRGGFVGVEY